jgi:hypothetical protein
VLLVDRQVVGQERPLGKEEAGHRLARHVHEAADAEAYGRLEHVERRHQVVLEHGRGRVVGRLRDGGGVDDRVHPAGDRERVACAGEVGLHVGRLAGQRPVEDASRDVRDGDLVPGPRQAAAVTVPTLPRPPVTSTRMSRDLPGGRQARGFRNARDRRLVS